MKKRNTPIVTFGILAVALASANCAQAQDAFSGPASAFRDTPRGPSTRVSGYQEPTVRAAVSDDAPVMVPAYVPSVVQQQTSPDASQDTSTDEISAGQGQSLKTMTQVPSGLKPARSGLMAPNSVNPGGIPSGTYTDGFSGGGGSPSTSGYGGLPPTATSSCLPISILDDEKGTSDGGVVQGNDN